MVERSVEEVAALIGAESIGDTAVKLRSVTHDSGSVGADALFCCVTGARHDGHDFAPAAVSAGAVALLCSRRLELDVPQILVEDVRAAMGSVAAHVYGDPSESLAVVGVTGTNGKTTVVTLLAEVLRSAGRRCEVIGTLTGARTTPEAPELQARLASWTGEGVDVVAMEVSSHALELHRVDGTRFRVAVFTNLGTDHLDFHGTHEAYFAAKAKLFEPGRCDHAVVNLDDPHGRLLRDAAEVPVVGYSVEALDHLELGRAGSVFSWRGHRVELPMPGRYNVANALAVAEVASLLGVEETAVVRGLGVGVSVPGRFELVEGAPGAVVVDFAHTPDALRSVLGTAREMLGPHGRLVVVFGCGGDRDASKRPKMGEVACEMADSVVLTNDNPRSEDPLSILAEIRSGCSGEPLVLPDRRAAIRAALSVTGSEDVVVIAGKGHEQGQELEDRIEPFDDRVVAAEEIRAMRGGGS
jgi:UDP-N-acetylmuramoyl-L-alanyl-D-glutamate--2,6-diaminopimelate ligase